MTIKHAALVATLAITAPAAAILFDFEPQIPPPPPAEVPSQTWLRGEALYWASGQPDFNYAEVGNIVQTNPPLVGGTSYQSNALIEDLTSVTADAEYNWGFRVGAGREFDQYFLTAQVTWWEAESINQVTRGANNTMTVPPLLFDAGNVTGFQVSTADLLNQALWTDIRFGAVGSSTCRGRWEYFGVVNAHTLKNRNAIKAFGNMTIDQTDVPIYGRYALDLEQKGLGFGGGFNGHAQLPWGFYTRGRIQSTATWSTISTRVSNHTLTPARLGNAETYERVDTETIGGTRTCLFLAFHGRVELRWTHELCGNNLDVGIAYEVFTHKLAFYLGPALSISYVW